VSVFLDFDSYANTEGAFKIARRTKSLTQYVSSPQWYVPRDNPLYTDTQKTLFHYVPGWARAYRLLLAYRWEIEAFKLQGDTQLGRRLISCLYEGHDTKKISRATSFKLPRTSSHHIHSPILFRCGVTLMLSELGCKRLVFDSNYFQSLHSDNVDLKFTRVKEVTETGLVGADGSKKDFDIVVWPTGFLGSCRAILSTRTTRSNAFNFSSDAILQHESIW
jgi:cation diffusion facilitator CzcD-associated flavoprotein CzcO